MESSQYLEINQHFTLDWKFPESYGTISVSDCGKHEITLPIHLDVRDLTLRGHQGGESRSPSEQEASSVNLVPMFSMCCDKLVDHN